MGYFKWYWTRHGFFSAIYHFFAKRTIRMCVYQIFYNIGLAIGAFFFKKHVIPLLDLQAFAP